MQLGCYDHQLAIIEVFLKLKKLYPDSGWISERRLTKERYEKGLGKAGHIADGILCIDEKKHIPIEIELSMKSRARLLSILKEYRKQLHLKEVWYFCAPKILPKLNVFVQDFPFIKLHNITEFLA